MTGVESITVDGLTADRAVVTDGSKKIASSATTATELGYVSGVTSAIQTQLNDKLDDSQRGAPNGVASLDAGGKVPQSELPAIAITDTFVVASQAAMLALSAETGDIAVRTDLNKTFILAGSDPAILGNWQELLTPTDTVLSVNGQTGTVSLSTSDISEGTNLYYTDERAQDAIGTILTDTNDIDLSYNDGTPSISADLRSSSITAKTEVTADIADFVMISDTSDSGNLKKADLGDFLLPSATQVVTNKDIDGGTASNSSRLTVPKDTYANLLSLTRKEGTLLYATDLDTFFADDGSTLTAVGSGGGSGTGSLNIVDNPSAATATTGWTAAANYTVTRNTTDSPLEGVIDTCFAISTSAASSESSTSGVYAASLAMPPALRNSKVQCNLWVTVPATADGVWCLSVYNSGGTRMTLDRDSSSVFTLPGGYTGELPFTFDAADSATYTINFTQTTRTNANTLYATLISIGNGQIGSVPAVGNWQSYTPTGSWSSNTTYTGKWRRDGSDMLLQVQVATSGAPTSTSLTVNLPSGYTIDTNALVNTTAGNRPNLGIGNVFDGTTEGYTVQVTYNTTTSVALFALGSGGTYSDTDSVSQTVPITFGASDGVVFNARVPIAEWAGSVSTGPAPAEEFAATSGTWDAASTTTVYGPGGQAIGGTLTAARAKTVTWQYPTQTDDEIAVEYSSDQTTWVPLNMCRVGTTPIIPGVDSAGNEVSGVYTRNTSSTQTEVLFGRYANIANDDAPTANWPASGYWRVRKTKKASLPFANASSSATGLVAARKGQTTLTVTCSASGWSTIRAVGIYYQDQDGNHRLKFNIVGTCAASARTRGALTVSGVTFKNTTNYYQPVSLLIDVSGISPYAYVNPNTSTINVDHASGSTSYYGVSGDVELESKPSWA